MNLAERMKGYESVSKGQLVRRVPVVIRADGKAFHTLTRGCEKPFDSNIMDCMYYAAEQTSKEMQGFKAAYIQSDEVSFLLTDYEDITTEGWFDYKLYKLISISSALMSTYFTQAYGKMGLFDARAFNVPREDVVNCFLWRAQDWKRNSLQMFARASFSHKELHNKNSEDIHDMLHSIGKNWTIDLSERQKNGTFITKEEVRHDILPTYEDINNLLVNYI
jgi:tRNA(His) 5'-end guanylyltransferase